MGLFRKKHIWGISIFFTCLIVIVVILQSTQHKSAIQETVLKEEDTFTTEVSSEQITSIEMTSNEITSIEMTTFETTDTESTTVEVATVESTNEEPYIRPFAEYIEQNPDFVGWITVEGTSIDAPIVQSVDNEYYLIHDYTGARNITGAIYMDYKNLGNFYDNHMSLYGHYMTDGSIFHDLHHFKDQTFFENNDTITIHGLRESKEYEIFSVHVVSAYTYYLYLDLKDEALLEYAKHFQRQSMFKKDVTFPKDLSLLTLVTCTYEYDNARILIHAYAK